jgi:pyruvate/2-oxoglutarate dehydrogenase complex dihydrolipoamide dehydrogenase (E3) component
MTANETADLCIVGAGAGGLSVAAAAAKLGARTVLIERGAMGGECLNSGCVPSKSLLAAAGAAEAIRRARRFGVSAGSVTVDGDRVQAHIRAVIAQIAPHDSAERFRALGCRVIEGEAHFDGPLSMVVNGERLDARYFVVATGSRPAVPAIDGLSTTPFLTNETIFDVNTVPRHLLILGGGPVGVEMAQAWRRLGAAVTLFERDRILPRDDAELTNVLRDCLVSEGVTLHENILVERVEGTNGTVRVFHRSANDGDGGDVSTTEGSHLLVAVGRVAETAALELAQAGITMTDRGITVDRRLRTTNPRVFAVGDVIGDIAGIGPSPRLTHAASYQAGIVIRNALFRWPARLDPWSIPHVTYTDPELAQVGLTEEAAAQRGHNLRVLEWPVAQIDRAQAEGETTGSARVLVNGRGNVIGAGIVGRHAGELILPWVLAVKGRLTLSDMAKVVVPYPTRSELTQRVAADFFSPSLFSRRTRALVRLLSRLP